LATARWSDLWLTAVARGLAGLDATFEALPAERLRQAAEACFQPDGSLRPESREAVHALEGAPESFLALAVGRLEEELGGQVAAGGAEALAPPFSAPWIVALG